MFTIYEDELFLTDIAGDLRTETQVESRINPEKTIAP